MKWTRLHNGEVPPEVQPRFLKLWSHRTGVLSHQVKEMAQTDARVKAVGRFLRGNLCADHRSGCRPSLRHRLVVDLGQEDRACFDTHGLGLATPTKDLYPFPGCLEPGNSWRGPKHSSPRN